MKCANGWFSLTLCCGLFACGGDDDEHSHNEGEVITTVTLTFSPQGGGDPIVAQFQDADGDGGDPPVIDDIVLDAKTYDLAVKFENALEDPPEDITQEVADEADEHQVFFTGSAVNGPASDEPSAPLQHQYADADSNGFPIGLENTMEAMQGAGALVVTLRHVPPINGAAVKQGDLADIAKESGLSTLPGDVDAQVEFAVTVTDGATLR